MTEKQAEEIKDVLCGIHFVLSVIVVMISGILVLELLK